LWLAGREYGVCFHDFDPLPPPSLVDWMGLAEKPELVLILLSGPAVAAADSQLHLSGRVIAVSTASPIWPIDKFGSGSFTASRS